MDWIMDTQRCNFTYKEFEEEFLSLIEMQDQGFNARELTNHNCRPDAVKLTCPDCILMYAALTDYVENGNRECYEKYDYKDAKREIEGIMYSDIERALKEKNLRALRKEQRAVRKLDEIIDGIEYPPRDPLPFAPEPDYYIDEEPLAPIVENLRLNLDYPTLAINPLRNAEEIQNPQVESGPDYGDIDPYAHCDCIGICNHVNVQLRELVIHQDDMPIDQLQGILVAKGIWMSSVFECYHIIRNSPYSEPWMARGILSFKQKVKKTHFWKVNKKINRNLFDQWNFQHFDAAVAQAHARLEHFTRSLFIRREPRLEGQGGMLSAYWLNVGPLPDYVHSLSETFKAKFAEYWNKLKGMLSMLPDSLIDVIRIGYFKVSALLSRILVRTIDEIKAKLGEAGLEFIKAVLVRSLFYLACYLIVRSLGIFSPAITTPVWNVYVQSASEKWRDEEGKKHRVNSSKVEVTAFGQAEPDFVTLMSTICLGVIGLKVAQFERVKKHISTLTELMAGGTVLSNSIKLFLVLLPPILKVALVHKFGTKDGIYQRDLEEWRSRAQAWTSLSKVPTVAIAKKYAEEIEKCIQEGGKLLRQADNHSVPASIKQTVVSAYINLFKIHSIILQRRIDSGGRLVPFAFHFAGVSGIGKTTSIKDILKELGYDDEQIANKNCAETFWTGCQGKPVILMDEFLLASQEDNHRMMQEYLVAVSNAEWRPEFASLDDPSIGIKGTYMRPEVIVTMNNTCYDRVDEKINSAFYRRRSFVIDAKRTKHYRSARNSPDNVDISSYTDEECKNRVWAKYNILTSSPAKGGYERSVLRKDLTYSELKDFIQEQYLRHKELNERIRNLDPNMTDMVDPEEIMNSTLRDVYSLPCKAPTLTEAIACVFKPITVCQGPKFTKFLFNSDPVIEEIKSMGQGGIATTVLSEEEEASFFEKYGTLTLGASAAALIALFSWLGNSANGDTDLVEETTYGQSAKTNKTSKPSSRARPSFQRYSQITAQGPDVQIVELEFQNQLIKGIPIKDKWILTYAHCVRGEPFGEWKIYVNGKMHECIISDPDVMIDHDNDLMLLNFANAKQLQNFKNIIKLFATSEELDKLSACQIGLSTPRGNMYVNMAKVATTPYFCADQRHELSQAGKYFAPTELGDCGLPVICRSGGLIGKIAGIHIAGTGSGAINPFGLCTFTPREMFEEVLVSSQGPTPNLVKIEPVQSNEFVSLPSNSKLKPSEISAFIPWDRIKQPAILSSKDPRAEGECPVRKSLDRLFEKEDKPVDRELCDEIKSEMLAKFKKVLKWPVGKRRLTFEEAVGGVPKWLNSLTMTSSPGYPLCKFARKKGKTDYCWFEGQDLHYTPEFKKLVLERVAEIDSYDGESQIGNRFLMYTKDELVSNKKINECKTRATFANDLVSLVAFRIVFGSVFIAFQHSFQETGYAIGLNQYSEDMELIYQYLMEGCSGERFGAGDYENFDQRYLREISRHCYDIFTDLAIWAGVCSVNASRYLWKHEMEAPFQVLYELILVICSNKSGCWLTTIINCMVNEFYFRYCVKRKYPARPFSSVLRLTVLGDDNVYNVIQPNELTPLELSQYMSELGQKYTSAFKDRELRDEYDTFKEVTFLGALPVLNRRGRYTGALRKSTLETTPLWTRDDNVSLDAVVQSMLDCASQWDEEYFNYYVDTIHQAYQESGRTHWPFNVNYPELHNTVTRRTAASGEDFILVGQGPITVNKKSEFSSGLTQVLTAEEKDPSQEKGNLMEPIAKYSVSAETEDFAYGTESYVRRGDFVWSSTNSQGTILEQYNVPYDLLTLSNTESVQNIGFMNYEFCQPEVEVMFRVVGTPVQQGALVAWFTPFISKAQAVSTGLALDHWTTMDHIFLTPNNNTTRTITIPYRFFRTWLRNNFGFTNSEYESIGTLSIGVLSPLNVVSDPTSATVVIYTRFKSKFAVPRPRTASGQGASYSSISNSYTMGDVAGNVPNQSTLTSKQDVSNHATIPMDNPPISGGAVPVYNQYSSLSKGVGLEPTVSLQFCQAMLHREPDLLRYGDETNLQNICAKRGYIGQISISTSTAVDSEILNFNLNSVLQTPTLANQNSVPANLAVLNQFQRWRGDIVLEFFMAKTVFHSIRLQLVIAYGYTGALAGLDYNAFPQEIIEFTGETQWASVRIPYNACVEYLRTYDGMSSEFQSDDKLGCFSIFASTPLMVSSGVVSTSVQLNYFVRIDNVELYEPRPDPFVSLRYGQQLVQLVGQGPMDASSAFASPAVESVPETATINIDRKPGDDDEPADVSIVQPDTDSRKSAPCSMKTGRKYEYLITDILEVGRRHYYVPYKTIAGYTSNLFQSETSAYGDYNNNGNVFPLTRCLSFFVYPLHPICNLYGAWSGHLKYRIVISQLQQQSTDLPSGPIQVLHLANAQPSPTQTVNQFTGTDPPSTGTANSSIYPFFSAGNAQVLVGQTATNQTPGYASNTYLYKPDTAISSPAIEFLQYQSGSQVMIDVSVPFSTTSNMLPTTNGGTPPATLDNYNGTLAILLPNYMGGQGQDVRIYQAFGDDFRLHGWAPTTNSYADGVTKASFGTGTVTLPTGNVQIGYNVYQ